MGLDISQLLLHYHIHDFVTNYHNQNHSDDLHRYDELERQNLHEFYVQEDRVGIERSENEEVGEEGHGHGLDRDDDDGRVKERRRWCWWRDGRRGCLREAAAGGADAAALRRCCLWKTYCVQ